MSKFSDISAWLMASNTAAMPDVMPAAMMTAADLNSPSREIRSFLTALWPDMGRSAGWLLFWGLPSKRSLWVSDITDTLLADLTAWAEREDVYVGCGLAPRDYGPSLRCPAKEIAGIPGLWLDVDLKNGGHKKPNLPPDEASGLALIYEMGPQPSLIIHSGHGLQVWWLFREPWFFDTPQEREQAAALAKNWTSTLRAKAKAHGWDADATGDLARVMRLPGLWNRKGVPVATKLLALSELRYDPADFETYSLPETATSNETAPDLEWQFTMRADAEPPVHKFVMLTEHEPKFLRTWNHNRPDLQDQSASAYDLALATRAMMAGWTGQEIVDLMIAHRRNHGEDLKLREDYFRRTLNRAASGKGMEERTKLAESILAEQKVPEGVLNDKAECLALISHHLGLQVKNIRKFLTEPRPTVDLTLEDGRAMRLGGMENLIKQGKMALRLAELCNFPMPAFKPKEWRQIKKLLLACVEDVEVGTGATEMGLTRAWLVEFLSSDRVVEERGWKDALENGKPYEKGGAVFFRMSDFREYLKVIFQELITTPELAMRCRKLGCVEQKQTYRRGNATTSRLVWRLPDNFAA